MRLLIVDDNVLLLKSLVRQFSRHYEVFSADSAKAALEIISKESVDIIVSDYDMPDMNGVEFLDAVNLPCYKVIFSANPPISSQYETVAKPNFGALLKLVASFGRSLIVPSASSSENKSVEYAELKIVSGYGD